MKRIIKIFFLLAFIIPHDVIAEATPYVKVPPEMKTPEGFFKHSIIAGVENWVSAGTYYAGDCKYHFPAYVHAKDVRDPTTNKQQICAWTTTTCNVDLFKGIVTAVSGLITLGAGSVIAGGVLYGSDIGLDSFHIDKLGCIDIPKAPGPPPFCTHFAEAQDIDIIPYAGITAFTPKAAVLIGKKIKTCDGQKISLDLQCKPGQKEEILFGQTFELQIQNNYKTDSDYSDELKNTITYDGSNYHFATFIDNENSDVCVKYFGDSSNSSNDTPLTTSCFPIPDPEQFHVKKDSMNINKLHILFGEKCQIGEKCDKQLVSGASPVRVGGREYYAFRPAIDLSTHEMIRNIKCSDGKDAVKINPITHKEIPNPIPSNYPIPPRLELGCHDQTKKLTINFPKMSNAKITCVGFNSPYDFLQIKRNNDVFKLSKIRRKFMKYAMIIDKTSADPQSFVPCKQDQSYYFEEFSNNQTVLSSMKKSYASYYNISIPNFPQNIKTDPGVNPCKDNFRVYAYEDGVIERNIEDYKITNAEKEFAIKIDDKYLSYWKMQTDYTDLITGEPFFLTNKEKFDLYTKPEHLADPINFGMCANDFENVEYSTSGTHTIDGSCDFTTIEMWGGGGGAHYGSKNSGLVTQSGPSGNYALFSLKKMNPSKALKIEIGNGGLYSEDNVSHSSNVGKGGQTIVSLCNYTPPNTSQNKPASVSNCRELARANGGFNNDQDFASSFNFPQTLTATLLKGIEGDVAILPTLGVDSDIKISIPAINSLNKSRLIQRELSICSGSTAKPTGKVLSLDNPQNLTSYYPGQGGCLNLKDKVGGNGMNGKVVITCEKWQ